MTINNRRPEDSSMTSDKHEAPFETVEATQAADIYENSGMCRFIASVAGDGSFMVAKERATYIVKAINAYPSHAGLVAELAATTLDKETAWELLKSTGAERDSLERDVERLGSELGTASASVERMMVGRNKQNGVNAGLVAALKAAGEWLDIDKFPGLLTRKGNISATELQKLRKDLVQQVDKALADAGEPTA